MPDPVPVKMAIQIRWRDLDALGHVNNAVYLTYFELARLAYVRAVLGDRRADRPAHPAAGRLPVHPGRGDVPLPLAGHPGRPACDDDLGRASGAEKLRVRVPDHDEVTGRLVAEGCSTQVWYDYAAGESRPVPAEIVARMESMQGRRSCECEILPEKYAGHARRRLKPTGSEDVNRPEGRLTEIRGHAQPIKPAFTC